MKNKTFDFYNLLKFIKYPLITSKACHNYFENNQYIFIVDRSLTKIQIKYVIEKNYRIGVKSVNTAILPTRIKRIGKLIGNQPLYKKAYVKLEERIPFFFDYWMKKILLEIKKTKKLTRRNKTYLKKIYFEQKNKFLLNQENKIPFLLND